MEDYYYTDLAVSKAQYWLSNINNLWRRDYWRRTWIFQEIVLARDILIMCGEECIPWQDLTAVDKWLEAIRITDKHHPFYAQFPGAFTGCCHNSDTMTNRGD
jgi:hypothetical protein